MNLALPRSFEMQNPVFDLKVEDILYWAAQYPKHDNGASDKAFAAGRRIRFGELSPGNLATIVAWKSKRSASLISYNSDEEIVDALRLTLLASEPRSAFAVLMGLKGVTVPIASAILTAINPHHFTVIDYRALEGLGVPDADCSKLDYYLHHYFPECVRLSEEHGVDLRTFDRALWAWSKARAKREVEVRRLPGNSRRVVNGGNDPTI
jgi:hypothetical protein